MFVGRSKPVARISFWKELVFATLTVTGARRRRVAGRVARARRERVRRRSRRVRVSHASPYGAVVSSSPMRVPST